MEERCRDEVVELHQFFEDWFNAAVPSFGDPQARLLVLAFGFIPLRLPAVLVIGAFFAQDLLWGLTGTAAVQGVAVWAHIGGMVAGAGMVILLKRAHIPLWHRPPNPWD